MVKKILIVLFMISVYGCSLERQFIKNPKKASELCLKHYGCKDVESYTEIVKDTVEVIIKGDSIPCPPVKKPIEVINPDTGKPEIKFVEVPGPKVKCPDTKCTNTHTNTKTTVKVRDKAQDTLVEELKKEVTILESDNSLLKKILITLSILNGLYILYKLIKAKIKSKIP